MKPRQRRRRSPVVAPMREPATQREQPSAIELFRPATARAVRRRPTDEAMFMTETAIFAAGCFWGVEERFRKMPGVLDAEVGYTGGWKPDPTYHDVCTDKTGHAEAVRIRYDPDVISYEQLVTAFFAMHDPTTLNRQGPDVGTQYRSVIFAETPEQETVARAVVDRLQGQRDGKHRIVTEIVPASAFWRAEEHHQRYNEKHHRAWFAI